jgi:hypothetical protein
MLADDAPAEDVWNVLVDETTTVEADWEEDDVVVTESLELDESAEEVSEDEEVPPVLDDTLWRFAIARATSRLLAEADAAVKRARRMMASERMLMVASSAGRGR